MIPSTRGRGGHRQQRRSLGSAAMLLAGLAASISIVMACWPSEAQTATETTSLLHPIGPVMAAQAWHLLRVTLIGLLVVGPPILMTIFVVWRYRLGGKSATYWPNWEFNGYYETLIWAGPVVVVVVLGIWLVSSTLDLDPYDPLPGDNPLRIDLVGLDDKWLAIYPGEKIASVGEIAIPVGRPVAFRITSDTVMQSFLASGLAGQIYLMPGMVTQMHLAASEPGTAKAIQTQYDGSGFANQREPMHAMAPDDFDRWVRSASGPALDDASYGRLVSSARSVQEFEVQKKAVMPLADDCLFDRVVARYHQNTPIRPEAQPGSPAYDPAAASLPQGACEALLPAGFGAPLHGADHRSGGEASMNPEPDAR